MNKLQKNNKLPLISVIIPNYNNEETIINCIESCIRQKGDFRLEIIVVDDHSTDNSWHVLKELQNQYSNILKAYKNQTKGSNAARNYGFQLSSGNYIQWLDSDDIILPGKFQAQISALCYNNVDVVYSDSYLYYYDKNKSHISTVERKGYKTDDFLSSILKNEWNPIHSYLFTRKVVEKTINNKGWDIETKVGQDREFVTKAAISGAKFIYEKGFYAVYNIWKKPSISKVSHKNNILQSTVLNQKFYDLITENVLEKNKRKEYHKILNTEIVKSTYYYPALKFPRKISLKMVDWNIIDKRIIPFVGILAILKNINLTISEKA